MFRLATSALPDFRCVLFLRCLATCNERGGRSTHVLALEACGIQLIFARLTLALTAGNRGRPIWCAASDLIESHLAGE